VKTDHYYRRGNLLCGSALTYFAAEDGGPSGTFAEIEDRLIAEFQLKDAVVADCSSEEEAMVRELGAATAYFLETSVKPGACIGISSWSRSLFAMVDALHPGDYCRGGKVVQILGGVGSVGAQHHTTHLAQRLAALIVAKIFAFAVSMPRVRRSNHR